MAAKYKVVLQELSATIAEMRPGDQLPTEHQLAEQFGVSNMTVRRALEVLSNTKRIVGIRGRGTFVAQPAVTKRMTLSSFTDSMRAAGRTARAEVLSASMVRSDPETATQFDLADAAIIFRIERLRFGDDTPLCIDRSILPAELFPGLLGNDLSGSLYEILMRRYAVSLSRSESRISAVTPSSDDARLLGIGTGVPCLQVATRGSTTSGTTAEITTSLYRGDLYELLVEPA
jgi:GntR family transcriptional regulator